METKEMHQHCNMDDKDREDDDSIPLADDDPSVVIEDDEEHSLEAEKKAGRSLRILIMHVHFQIFFMNQLPFRQVAER